MLADTDTAAASVLQHGARVSADSFGDAEFKQLGGNLFSYSDTRDAAKIGDTVSITATNVINEKYFISHGSMHPRI